MQIFDKAKRIAVTVILSGFFILSGCEQQTKTGRPQQGGPPEVTVAGHPPM
jgi:hypothetical protein